MKTLLHKPLCYLFYALTYMLRSGGTWQTCFFVLAAGFNRFIRYRPVENLKITLKSRLKERGVVSGRARRGRRQQRGEREHHARHLTPCHRPCSAGHSPQATRLGPLQQKKESYCWNSFLLGGLVEARLSERKWIFCMSKFTSRRKCYYWTEWAHMQSLIEVCYDELANAI